MASAKDASVSTIEDGETREPVVNSTVRELCKAISQEEDSRRMAPLLDELLRLLDERQLMRSLL